MAKDGTHSHCRYKPKMLMDFIKMNVQKLNIPKLIHACERPHQVGTQVICFACPKKSNYDII